MTDHHHPTPAGASDDEAGLLAIPGDPRPWLVWAPVHPGGGLSLELARIVLDAYTVTGDVVIDVDDDVSFAAVAARTGRRHHALAGASRIGALGHAAGYIDMILLRWPRPAAHPHWLLRACRALLHTSGHLVVAVTADPSQRIATLSAITGAARTAELATVDHIAVLTAEREAPATGSRPSFPPGRPRRRRVVADDMTATLPSPVHTDLLILASEITSDD
jgi:hypothetical protein